MKDKIKTYGYITKRYIYQIIVTLLIISTLSNVVLVVQIFQIQNSMDRNVRALRGLGHSSSSESAFIRCALLAIYPSELRKLTKSYRGQDIVRECEYDYNYDF